MSKEIYVYIHVDKLTGLVIYCGKGTKSIREVKSRKCKGQKQYYDRAYNNKGRAYKIDETIEVIKVKYFDNNREALNYEEFLTNWYRACGQCWFNVDIGYRWSETHKENRRGVGNPSHGKTGANGFGFKGYIYCPQLDITFEGTNDAVRKCQEIGIKVRQSNISSVVNGNRKTHGYIIRDGKKIKLTWERINK
ncbi:MAG: hypothetical protein E6789_08050 [Clostridium baratii]|nr:hypothetical protein [Clostridium baratii]